MSSLTALDVLVEEVSLHNLAEFHVDFGIVERTDSVEDVLQSIWFEFSREQHGDLKISSAFISKICKGGPYRVAKLVFYDGLKRLFLNRRLLLVDVRW